MSENSFDAGASRIAALGAALPRALYGFVAAHDQAVSRDQAAAALGVSRSVAATHLDRLAGSGLLDVEFRRLSGRQGPGAGRPSKLYRRAAQETAISLPPRHYHRAADLLASAVTEAADTGAPVQMTLERAAHDRGAAMGRSARQRAGTRPGRAALARCAADVLAEEGYEPRLGESEIMLTNCPFDRLAAEHTALVCGMNHALLEAMAAALPETRMAARLAPTPGRCCVRLQIDRR